MQKRKFIIVLITILTLLIVGFIYTRLNKPTLSKSPIQGQIGTTVKKILYYRNPMNPEINSPVPMKDSMGMDYIPVYEEEREAASLGIHLSQEKEQLIGVKKEKAAKRHLFKNIITVGKVSFNPQLYVAQQEYLQALKSKAAGEDISRPLIEASTMKLLLLGMSKEEIGNLNKNGKPDENLYLPLDSVIAWVYLTVFEYEANLVKPGLPVEIEAVAFPGEKFQGEITAITPVLDAMTRSLQVRAKVNDPGHKLKPEMFVNACINVDLGEKLAIPETAVLDTGLRKIVYVSVAPDTLVPREVELGQKADGFYEVLAGLSEGELVVTSGNFLVDSESKLEGITAQIERK